MTTNERKTRRTAIVRRNRNHTLFNRLTPAECRDARAIAYQAALAVIG